jgi:hypothetical protein
MRLVEQYSILRRESRTRVLLLESGSADCIPRDCGSAHVIQHMTTKAAPGSTSPSVASPRRFSSLGESLSTIQSLVQRTGISKWGLFYPCRFWHSRVPVQYVCPRFSRLVQALIILGVNRCRVLLRSCDMLCCLQRMWKVQ